MLAIITMILSVVLLVLNVFVIRAAIWYREELKSLDDARKQYEKLSKEYEVKLAEKENDTDNE